MKEKILIHSCCAPCSTATIESLIDPSRDLMLFYYNPNISPAEEEEKRYLELVSYVAGRYQNDVAVIKGDYDHAEWKKLIEPIRMSGENSFRCKVCYYLRLLESFKTAASLKADTVTTTLSISPYKNYDWLDEIGLLLSKSYGIKWFLKRWDYRRSVELSKEYGLYRQNYCGCEYSRAERDSSRGQPFA
jgi:epoxyqueuosine reductase